MNNGSLIDALDDTHLIKLLSDKNEVEHLTQQLDDNFLIDFNKINPTRVKEYIDPLKRKDSLGNLIIDFYYSKIFSSRKYSFSKPVFSLNNQYSLMIVSRDNNSIQLKAYKKEKNEWKLYNNIVTPMN